MKGFVFIGPDGTGEGLKYWIDLALDFNSRAKASKKKETSRRTVRKGKGRKTAKKSKKRVVRRAKR
jgi:hypothetical protein